MWAERPQWRSVLPKGARPGARDGWRAFSADEHARGGGGDVCRHVDSVVLRGRGRVDSWVTRRDGASATILLRRAGRDSFGEKPGVRPVLQGGRGRRRSALPGRGPDQTTVVVSHPLTGRAPRSAIGGTDAWEHAKNRGAPGRSPVDHDNPLHVPTASVGNALCAGSCEEDEAVADPLRGGGSSRGDRGSAAPR